jgi:transposase, IS30 family
LPVTAHLTAEQRQLALRLKARGLSLREIGPQVGCSHQGVALIARQRPRRSVHQDRWVPGPGRLTLADREEITLGVHAGQSFTAIAARLGLNRSVAEHLPSLLGTLGLLEPVVPEFRS